MIEYGNALYPPKVVEGLIEPQDRIVQRGHTGRGYGSIHFEGILQSPEGEPRGVFVKQAFVHGVPFLRRYFKTPEYLAGVQIRREHQILAELNKIGIGPTVFGYMETPVKGGTLVTLVEELIEGKSLLAETNADNFLNPANGIEIAIGLLTQLDSMHRWGIMHRDIKPENVIVKKDDPLKPLPLRERVRLVDFGQAIKPSELRKAPDGDFVTPKYMSPEQPRGYEGVTYASDIYSLALVVAEFFLDLPRETMLQQQRIKDPDNGVDKIKKYLDYPGDKDVVCRQLREKGISQPYIAWFAKALSHTPSDRFQTAGEMLDALNRIIAS